MADPTQHGVELFDLKPHLIWVGSGLGPGPFGFCGSLLLKIPAGLVGPSHTNSSALHSVWYTGPLHEWTTFEQDANAEFQQHDLERHNSTITIRPLRPHRPHNIANEQLVIGDETGLQGRFNQNVGHVMSAVYGSQGLNLRFGDYKSTNTNASNSYKRVPDMVIMDQVTKVRALGDLKSQWVRQHHLRGFPPTSNVNIRKTHFRRQIGRLARYMQDLQVRYGFYSTYGQHIFLSQEVDGPYDTRRSFQTRDTRQLSL